MRRVVNAVLTATMVTALYCAPAIAEESSPHAISGIVTFGTDYYWRGYSATDNGPSVQGEIDYEHKSGFYAGIWGGNIDGHSEYVDDFDEWTYASESTNVELDFWIGYWKELGPIELDLTATYYYYPDDADAGLNKDPDILDWTKGEAEADMVEFHIGLAHRFNMPTTPKLSVGYDYTPNFSLEDGAGHLLDLGLPLDIGLAFEAGYQMVDGDKTTGCDGAGTCYGQDGEDGFDYTYFRVGLSREFFGLNCDLSYWYNSEEEWFESEYDEGKDEYGYATAAKDTFILTVSYSF